MIDRILIPLDGSREAEAAIEQGDVLAQIFGAGILLLAVVELGRPDPIGADSVLSRLQRARALVYLEPHADRLRKRDLAVEIEVREGMPADEIINACRERSIDLVVLTRRGRSGSERFPLGGVAQKVIARAGVSILLVRTPTSPVLEEPTYRRIIVPVDGSQRAEWAVHLAAMIARGKDAELLIAQTVSVPELDRALSSDPEVGALRRKLVQSNRRAAQAYLDGLKMRIESPDLRIRTRVAVSSTVAETLHKLAEDEEADLIVGCAHGATGSSRWPYGSIATNLIAYGQAPLLVLQDVPTHHRQSSRRWDVASVHFGWNGTNG